MFVHKQIISAIGTVLFHNMMFHKYTWAFLMGRHYQTGHILTERQLCSSIHNLTIPLRYPGFKSAAFMTK
jgi:hypothetical protein